MEVGPVRVKVVVFEIGYVFPMHRSYSCYSVDVGSRRRIIAAGLFSGLTPRSSRPVVDRQLELAVLADILAQGAAQDLAQGLVAVGGDALGLLLERRFDADHDERFCC